MSWWIACAWLLLHYFFDRDRYEARVRVVKRLTFLLPRLVWLTLPVASHSVLLACFLLHLGLGWIPFCFVHIRGYSIRTEDSVMTPCLRLRRQFRL